MLEYLPLKEGFLLGGWFSIVVALGFTAFGAYMLEREGPGRVAINFVALAILLACLLFSDLAYRLAYADRGTAALWLAGYLAIGPLWGLFRWTLFVICRRNRYVQYEKECRCGNSWPEWEKRLLEERDYGGVFDDVYWPWRAGGRQGAPLEIRPRAVNHTARITSWMMYWPLSVVGWLLSDALGWVKDALWLFWRGVQRRLAAAFDAISHSIFGDIGEGR